MDQNEAINSVRKYASRIESALRPEQVILYGSYASGTARGNSDIDVAVIVKRISGDFLDLATMLYKMRRDIDDRIEPILLEETNDSSGFLSHVRKTGVVIFDQAAKTAM